MRKLLVLILVLIPAGTLLTDVLTIGAGAQSGRKITKALPPPPPEKLSEPPLVLTERKPVGLAPLMVVPDALLKRPLKSLDKGSFSLADFSGKVIVINLWASWCGPCRREVPEYEKVRKDYVGREVEFIGLTTEDPRTDANRVRQFVRDFHFGFRLGWADRETALTLMNGREAVPQTLVIATDGRIVGHWSGYSTREGGDRLRTALKNALAEVPMPASAGGS